MTNISAKSLLTSVNPTLPMINGLIFTVGVSVSACTLGSGQEWKEEVLLHDGKRIVIERWQTVNPLGPREIGQPPPRSEEGIRFAIPGTKKIVNWKSDFGKEQEQNLSLLMLNFVGSTPYIATTPLFCHAYNKWGRPNPPYVFFKHDGDSWQRIELQDFPVEFKRANVLVGGFDEKKLSPKERGAAYLPIETLENQNRIGLQPYMRAISRMALSSADAAIFGCPPVFSGIKAPLPTAPSTFNKK